MKVTINVDGELLRRVMQASGVTSKTKAVDLALREMDRRAELKRLAAEGLDLSANALRGVYDPASVAADRRAVKKAFSRGSRPRSR